MTDRGVSKAGCTVLNPPAGFKSGLPSWSATRAGSESSVSNVAQTIRLGVVPAYAE